MFWGLTLVTDTQVMVANIHFKCTLHYSWVRVHSTGFQPSFYGQNHGHGTAVSACVI